MKPLAVLACAFLTIPTAACGQPSDPAFARANASQVKGDCLKAIPDAPNAAFARHLTRLCDCVYGKIAATPLSRSDDNDTINRKIQPVYNACLGELGGEADAEDYRATGLKPPSSSPSH